MEYTHSIAGLWSFPGPLPFRLVMPDGMTRTDPASFTTAEIARAGFVPAPKRPAIDATASLLIWDEAGCRWLVEPLPPAPEPQPRPLTRLAFVTLVQQAGGMSPALYLQARRDEAFAYLWDMLNFAEEVARDDELTAQALGSLAAGGYLPNGVDAVRGAWPAV